MRLPEHASHLPCRFFPPLAACAPGPALLRLALLTGLAALPHLPDCSTVLSLWGQSPTFAYHVRPFRTLRCHAACASATGNSLQVPTQHTATRCTCCFPRPLFPSSPPLPLTRSGRRSQAQYVALHLGPSGTWYAASSSLVYRPASAGGHEHQVHAPRHRMSPTWHPTHRPTLISVGEPTATGIQHPLHTLSA